MQRHGILRGAGVDLPKSVTEHFLVMGFEFLRHGRGSDASDATGARRIFHISNGDRFSLLPIRPKILNKLLCSTKLTKNCSKKLNCCQLQPRIIVHRIRFFKFIRFHINNGEDPDMLACHQDPWVLFLFFIIFSLAVARLSFRL